MKLKTLQQRSLSTLLLTFFLCLPAYGLDLGEAKSRGLVGETTNGYIAAIKPSADVNTLVTHINGLRKARYQGIATKNAISLQAVEVRAGKMAIAKTPQGQLVDQGSGWEKK
jgi:uncharacterized protein YdbL (DUF1318 family)